MPNCLQYPIAIIGALKAGLIVVNTNPLYTPEKCCISSMTAMSKPSSSLKILPTIWNKSWARPRFQLITTSLGEMLGAVQRRRHQPGGAAHQKLCQIPHCQYCLFKEALNGGQKFTLQPLVKCSWWCHHPPIYWGYHRCIQRCHAHQSQYDCQHASDEDLDANHCLTEGNR